MKNPGEFLRSRGWWKAQDGLWHCAVLSFGWPLKDALRLESECDKGYKQARGLLSV